MLIKDRLEALGKFVLSDQLETELRDGAIWEDAQGCCTLHLQVIFGKSLPGRVGGVLVSNFTVTPTYSVTYDTGELYKAMEVDCR